MDKIIAATVLGSLILVSSALSQETFTGVWVVTTHVPEIEFDGTRFTVTSTFQPAGVGEEFVIENSGVIDGDTFEGTSKFGGLGEYRLTGVRQ